MKAYLQGKFKRLFINPEKLLPEGVDASKTIDSDIESPNGKPLVIYKGEKVEIHVTEESYSRGKARVVGLMGLENCEIERRPSHTDREVILKDYPEILKLYEDLLAIQ